MNDLDIREELFLSQPPRRWRKRLILGGLVLVALSLATPILFVIVSANRELQEAIAEANGLDPGWRISDLEAKRAVIPDEENSGLVLRGAKSLLPPNWPFWDHPPRVPENQNRTEEELRDLQDGLRDVEPPVQLDERQTKAVREELRRAEKALMAVRKVAGLSKGRHPIKYTKDFISTLLPHIQDSRTMGDLLAYDVLLRAQDKDVDGALTSCRGILNCGRAIGDEPTMISMLVRIALNHVATKKAERTLAQGEPPEAALLSIQHELEEEAEQPLLLIGARGDRGMTDGAMQAIQEGDLDSRYAHALLSGDGGGQAVLFGTGPELLRVPGMGEEYPGSSPQAQ